jgi:hypothetical protein
MSARAARHPLLAVCALTLLLHQACFSVRPSRTQYRPWDAKVIAKAERVRVEMVDKSVLELVEVTLEESAQGTVLRGTLVDDRGHSLGAVVLPAIQVSQLETRRLEGLRVVAKIGAWVGIAVVGAFVLLVLAVVCMFGRCPNPQPTLGDVGALRSERRAFLWRLRDLGVIGAAPAATPPAVRGSAPAGCWSPGRG